MRRAIYIISIAVLVTLVTITAAGCKGQQPSKNTIATDSKKPQLASKDTNGSKKSEKITSVKSIAEIKTMKITLYFSDSQALHLVAETREVEETESVAKVAMEELAKGPKGQGHYQTIPSSSKVNGVTVNSSGIAFVNFSKEFVNDNPGGSTGERLAVYSVVDTLTELPNIKSAKFLVDGKAIDTLTGHLDLSDPVTRDEKIIKKEQ